MKEGKGNQIFQPNRLFSAISVALLATTGVDIPTAQAQGGALVIEEVVVTARRREERLQDVPIAVTALSGDELIQRGITEVIHLRQVTPGMTVSRTANGPATIIYGLRGQQARDTVITQDAPVALYVDEVIMTPVAGSGLGLFDLESVQVLKGPQGTLFGRNTTGGAILYSTRKPEEEFGGYVRLSYGKYDERKVDAAINVPVSDSFRVRGALHYIKSDGFGDVTAGPAKGDGVLSQDETSYRITAAWDPTDRISTLTTYYDSDATYGASPFTIPESPRIGGPAWFVFDSGLAGLPPNTLSDAIARNSADYDIESLFDVGHDIDVSGGYNTTTIELTDNLLFKNIISYRESDTASVNDMDGTIVPLLDINNITFTDSWSEEAQLQGNAFDDRLDFIAGFFYYELDGLDGGNGTVFFGAPGNIQGGDIKNESFSGFAQIGYDLSDKITLNAGYRYTVDNREIDAVSGPGTSFKALTGCLFTDDEGNPLPADACVVHNDKSFTEPSWLIGLDYHLDDRTLLYIASRHSYRSGGFNLRGNANDFIKDFYNQEVVTDVEFGVKTEFELGRSWGGTANLAVWRQWYEDVQRNISTVKQGAIGNITRNAAEAKVVGGELELTLQYEALLRLTLGYAYVDAEYDKYPTVAPVLGVPAQPTDYSHYDFAGIYHHQVNSSLSLTPNVGDLGELSLTLNFYYQSSNPFSEDWQTREELEQRIDPATWAGIPNPVLDRMESLYLLNARIALDNIAGSGFSVAIWGDNLTDERVYDNAFMFQDSMGASYATLGPPRTYGVEVGYEF